MKWAILRKVWGNPIDYATLVASVGVLCAVTFALLTPDPASLPQVRCMVAIYIHLLLLACVILGNQMMLKDKLGV